IAERAEGGDDDVAPGAALHVDDEGHPAGVVLEARVVEAERARKGAERQLGRVWCHRHLTSAGVGTQWDGAGPATVDIRLAVLPLRPKQVSGRSLSRGSADPPPRTGSVARRCVACGSWRSSSRSWWWARWSWCSSSGPS